MTYDPHTDWGPLAVNANAIVRELLGQPPVDPADDLAAYRAAEGKSRAAEGDDSAAEVIAENRLAVRIDADPRGDDRAADVFYDKRWGIA